MSDFSFLAVPNIEGMRLGRYIQIFGIVIIFGICLFVVIYFWLRYYRRKKFVHHLDFVDQQSQDISKQLLIQKVKKASDTTKLILFIEYLEKFITTEAYANIGELLSVQGFTQKDIEECEHILYSDKKLSNHIAHLIDTYFIS